MDFITRLDKTKESHNYIVVVVVCFSKMAHFLPCKKMMDAQETTTIFFRHIIKSPRVPHNIISDRDVNFTNNFWRTLWRVLACDLEMSTAFHPQTDGQTHVVNRIPCDML